MVYFEFFFRFEQLVIYRFHFCWNLVSLLLKIRFFLLIFLNFLVELTDFSDSFEIFVIVLDNIYVWFFLFFILELLFIIFFLLALFIFLVLLVVILLLFLLLHLLLLFKFLYPSSFPNFVIPDYSLSHIIILRIDELF